MQAVLKGILNNQDLSINKNEMKVYVFLRKAWNRVENQPCFCLT